MADIKGRVLLDSLEAIKARAGQAEVAKIVGSLSTESRKVFESPILFSEWYPLDAFVEFLEKDIQLTAGGDREALAVRSEKVVEGQLRGIYKIFVKLGSPGFVINRIAAVHATYFRGIEIVPQVEGHSATIRYMGFRRQHSIMEFAIMGFFRKALAVSGARQVRLKFTVPIAQGDTYLELAITWQ